jgi:hypothetical protein
MLLTVELLACSQRGPVPVTYNTNFQSGYASYYAEGVMDATVYVRQQMNHIPPDLRGWAGYVARPDCKEIGNTVWLRLAGEHKFLPYLVTDCARRDDGDGSLSWMQNNRILVEVDYLTWVTWGGRNGGLRIEMLDS